MEQQQTYNLSDWPGSHKKLHKKNVFNAKSQVLSLRFDPEDSMVAAGCSDGTLKIFHLHSNRLQMEMKTSDPKDSTPCTCMRWRPPQFTDNIKNVIVTGGADGKVSHWHVTSGKEISSFQEKDNQINTLDFNTDGTQLVTAGKDNVIRVYDEESQNLIQELAAVDWKESGHNNRIFTAQFLHDQPHLIMSGGWDMNVHFWDQRQKKSIKSFLGPKVSGESLDYKNGKILAGANTAKNQLSLWDFNTCTKIQDIDWEPGNKKENGAFVFGCQFSKQSDESILVGAHGVNCARIFDVKNNYTPFGSIDGFKNGIFSVDYGNYSNKFVAGGGDGIIVVASLISDANVDFE